MNNLVSIKNELVSNGYPELKHVRIAVSYFRSQEAYLEFTRNNRHDYLIEVDVSLKRVRPSIIKGGMAHELSHILKEVKMIDALSFIEGVLMDLLPFYCTHDERWADKTALRRGYGRELSDFIRYAEKNGTIYDRSDGLTVKELSNMLDKVKI